MDRLKKTALPEENEETRAERNFYSRTGISRSYIIVDGFGD